MPRFVSLLKCARLRPRSTLNLVVYSCASRNMRAKRFQPVMLLQRTVLITCFGSVLNVPLNWSPFITWSKALELHILQFREGLVKLAAQVDVGAYLLPWALRVCGFRTCAWNLRSKSSAYLGHNPWLCEQGNTLLHEIFEVELEEKRVRVCDLKLSQVEKVFSSQCIDHVLIFFVGMISKAWHLFLRWWTDS